MRNFLAIVSVMVFGWGFSAFANWPTYMGDAARSGISSETVQLSNRPAWVYETAHPPSPGFYTSLNSETLGPQKIMAMANTYDYAHAPILFGGNLYFGSSSEDAYFCLDAASGKEQWRFYAEGAVRLAGTVFGDTVLFGADDGFVYCLNAGSGELKWKFNAALENRRIIANGRPASQWPVRTGITVDENGTAYFAAGLFPASGGVNLYAVNVKTGKELWRRGIELPPQGYILKLNDKLYVPNGRASPAAYSAADGTPVVPTSDFRRQGGSSFVSLQDGMITYGPTESGFLRIRAVAEGRMDNYNAAANRVIDGLFTGLTGRRLIAHDDVFYFLKSDALKKLPREEFKTTLQNSAMEFFIKKRARTKSGVQLETDRTAEKEISEYTAWSKPLTEARSMILAGNFVVVGAENRLIAFDRTSGSKELDVEVDGTVWELAASGGRLYASTDKGKIYCFGKTAEKSGRITPSQMVPFSEERLTQVRLQVEKALAEADVNKGFALVTDLVDGALACQLAKQSGFFIICVTTDSDTAGTVRDNLVKAGLYGARVVVHTHSDGKLPYASYIANLILSEGGLPGFKPKETERLLQPYGGVQITADGSITRRGPLKGAGEWSHTFADSANTSCSGDERIGGLNYRIQWFGNPGDFKQSGWHYNGMGPLSRDGRLYLVKKDWVEAVDSYNGTPLWQREVPHAARFSIGREGGSACVDAERLYMAVQNDCQVFDVESGDILSEFVVPDPKLDWGFIAQSGELLFGSGQKKGASVTVASYGTDRMKGLWFASEAEFAVSELLFALDCKTGKKAWAYGSGKQAIVNSSIAIDDDRVYFVESRQGKILSDSDASVYLRDLTEKEAFLVALDRESGKVVWEKPFEFKTHTMLYLSVRDNTLVVSGGYHVGPHADQLKPSVEAIGTIAKSLGVSSKAAKENKIRFSFQALDARNGKVLWDAAYTSDAFVGNQHNYNVGHPVLTKTDVWHAPGEQYVARINLKTGAVKEYQHISRGKGCAMPTASECSLFYRSTAVATFDIASETQSYISRVSRPSCWMNILPAGGLVQMPEYSYGCNCAFPLQTSIVLIPEGE